MDFQLLEFDTEIFGFKVARILATKLSLEKLQEVLKRLQEQKIKLVYWLSDSTDKVSQDAAIKLKGFLSDEKVTYLINLKELAASNLLIDPEIVIYQENTPNKELEELALQAGSYSRFKMDPNFPKDLFFKIYRVWIKNSVNGLIADRVFTIQQKNKIVGMITLGAKNNRGDIGLLAVSAEFRGRNFGVKLVKSALAYFNTSGFSSAQVVTQKANIAACSLYEKCGFQQEKIENVYHFYLA
jgi:dTDP-4-amino-4,6-dideoxy-D-galactose acyltransferase